MIRVGIIGSENSHAAAFTQQFAGGGYGDIRVTALWGEDGESNRAQCEKFGVACLRPEDMLGQVDAVMITSRRGDLHLPYARPFVDRGMPVFIDKPFAMSVADARELTARIEKSGSPCAGGSSTRLVEDALALHREAAKGAVGGYIYAPVSMSNEYGGFWFYASHLCEIALTVFGYDPNWVAARETKAGVAAVLGYDSFSIHLGFHEGVYHYGGAVITREGVLFRPIDISDSYAVECREFARMLSTRQTPQPLSELAEPVYVMDAIARALKSGREEKIHGE